MLSRMDYPQFQSFREQLLMDKPQVLDLANTNVYGWRKAWGKPTPGVVEKAKYRCHLAEEYLAWLGIDAITKADILVSEGVRHSLLNLLPRVQFLVRPMDVYPEYKRIGYRAGVLTSTYSARIGVPWQILEQAENWTVLICDPLKPWGGQQDQQEYDRLIQLAQKQQGMVVVDGAYARKPHPRVVEGIAKGQPILWLGSLSKGWLMPWTFGVVLGHQSVIEPWRKDFQALPKQADKLQLAWELLVNDPQRPMEVEQMCRRARTMLIEQLQQLDLAHGLIDPGHGYLLRHRLSAEALLDYKILAVPGSVFLDHPNFVDHSILSAVGVI